MQIKNYRNKITRKKRSNSNAFNVYIIEAPKRKEGKGKILWRNNGENFHQSLLCRGPFWRWTERPGVLQSMGWQSRTGLSNWTKLNWRRELHENIIFVLSMWNKAVDLNLEWRLKSELLYIALPLLHTSKPQSSILNNYLNHKPPTSFPLYPYFLGDAKGIDKMQNIEKFSI